jgi:hypothetical protein
VPGHSRGNVIVRPLENGLPAEIRGAAPLPRRGTRAAKRTLERCDAALEQGARREMEKNVMLNRWVSKGLVGLLCMGALAGCSDEAMSTEEATAAEGEDDGAGATSEGTSAPENDLAVAAQQLGGFSHLLPRRGSVNDVIEGQFLGSGMLYAMNLRTGALVDAITASFYTPSLANNRFSTGDPFFARGPAGGTAGSAMPKLVCPAGFAAYGLYGRSGNRLDQLGLICAQIGNDGRPIESTVRAIGAYGGTGGTFFFDTCGAGKWLSGMAVHIALKSSGTNKIVSAVQGFCSNAS